MTQFYDLARSAIHKGKLTEQERDAIARRGKRKQWAWRRHVFDLARFLESREPDEALRRKIDAVLGGRDEE